MQNLLPKTALLSLLAIASALSARAPLKVAFLASGNGSNFEACVTGLREAEKKGIIEPAVLICNRKSAKVFERAERLEVPAVWLPAKVFRSMTKEQKEARRKEYAQETIATLKEHGVTPENGLVCGAGFMVIIHKDFLDHFKNRVISIHPALLPSFAGDSGIDDAWKYGVAVSGPTVHIVDEGMDTGPIIGQNPFIKSPNDTRETFEEKTHLAEWKLYPWVIEQIALGNMQVVDKSAEGGPERCVMMPPQPRELYIDYNNA